MYDPTIRLCFCCGKPLKGRSDKKFCDDYCRNNYNNQQKAKSNHSAYVRNINNALMKNRKILESLLPVTEKTSRATKDKLLRLGFQFKYLTHNFINDKGNKYYYCYDYGYLLLKNDWCLTVKTKDD